VLASMAKASICPVSLLALLAASSFAALAKPF
jgi:hypothetical protein